MAQQYVKIHFTPYHFSSRMSLPQKIKKHVSLAVSRLELTLDPRIGWRRLRRYMQGGEFRKDAVGWAALFLLATFSLAVMRQPTLFKLFLVAVYTTALLVPLTSQFVLPATPIFSWLLLFYSCQFINKEYRPHIWVSVLPTLESVLYGANISDILTRYTNPLLDVAAWIPYGIVHFAAPFVVAACLFVFGPPGAVKFFGSAFGYLNLVGVMVQILFPCAPPWYELRNGLTPANYDMTGSPGGLARIDALFHSSGYTKTFSGAPVPFGAFPSLHAGCATMEALMLGHFFPQGKIAYWGYVFWLYWSTMYLTHHYLIDVVAGASLAVASFYYFLPDNLRYIHIPRRLSVSLGLSSTNVYELNNNIASVNSLREQLNTFNTNFINSNPTSSNVIRPAAEDTLYKNMA